MSKSFKFGIRELFATMFIVCAVLSLTVSPAFAKSKNPIPKSCLLALDAAEEGFLVAADFAGAVGDYVSGLQSAAQVASNAGGTTAAVGVFLQTQANLLQVMNSKAEIANSEITGPAQRFNLYKAKCRAGK